MFSMKLRSLISGQWRTFNLALVDWIFATGTPGRATRVRLPSFICCTVWHLIISYDHRSLKNEDTSLDQIVESVKGISLFFIISHIFVIFCCFSDHWIYVVISVSSRNSRLRLAIYISNFRDQIESFKWLAKYINILFITDIVLKNIHLYKATK